MTKNKLVPIPTKKIVSAWVIPTFISRPKKSLTPEGVRAKHVRLVARKLEVQYPEIYAALSLEAQAQINADNQNPLVAIQDKGLDRVHNSSPSLKLAKSVHKKQLRQLLRGEK